MIKAQAQQADAHAQHDDDCAAWLPVCGKLKTRYGADRKTRAAINQPRGRDKRLAVIEEFFVQSRRSVQHRRTSRLFELIQVIVQIIKARVVKALKIGVFVLK